jgi:hypothetical protein
MGCDIHGFWEVKTKSGAWIAFREVNDSRSYDWFGLIAGVRTGNRETCETAGRGVPDDVGAAWRDYCAGLGADLHSKTWLYPDEIAAANVEFKIICEKYNDEGDSNLILRIDHEPIPQVSDMVPQLYVGMSRDNVNKYPWTGTLDAVAGTDDLTGRLRVVIGFDS